MLKAVHSETGVDVLGWDAERGGAYSCPHCKSSVVVKKGDQVVHHFAHAVAGDCPNRGEGVRHIEMKVAIGDLFGGWCHIDYEVPVVKGRRADVVAYGVVGERPLHGAHLCSGGGIPPVESIRPIMPSGGRWTDLVVECQASSLSEDELDARTRDYLGAGVGVVWVFDRPLVGDGWRWCADKWSKFPARIPKYILGAAQWDERQGSGAGVAYVLEGPALWRLGFRDARERWSEWQGHYVPKYKKHLTRQRVAS